MKYIFLILLSLWFSSCSSKKITPTKVMLKSEDSNSSIYDLQNLPQDAQSYLQNITISPLKVTQDNYEKNYFRAWRKIPSDTKKTAMWPFRAYRVGESYGENLQPLTKDFFARMKENANFDQYKSVNKYALTLGLLNIRAFPTSKPLLHDPSQAGEGFPFDYMQNSTVCANKPILISHYSQDRKWAYIFTSFTGGWVKVKDIVIIKEKYTKIWQKAQQVFLLKDGEPIYDTQGMFLFYSRIGMMLALIDEDKENYTVLTIASYKGLKPLYLKSKISKKIASKGIITFSNKNIISILNQISKSKYGWGGIYEQRDCSSTLRDFYAPFGLWLPRNSSQQAKKGKVFNIEHLDDNEKIKFIKEKAVPFKTLLHKRGHILLFVGIYKNKIVAFHNLWGIKTKKNAKEGRFIIGRAVFSTLHLGLKQKDYDQDADILKNLKSINIVSN